MTTVLKKVTNSDQTVTLTEVPGTWKDIINPTQIPTDAASHYGQLGLAFLLGYLLGR